LSEEILISNFLEKSEKSSRKQERRDFSEILGGASTLKHFLVSII
jgi:hypothetical protein